MKNLLKISTILIIAVTAYGSNNGYIDKQDSTSTVTLNRINPNTKLYIINANNNNIRKITFE